MRVLGIETSCDETAAAVIEDGSVILSNVVVSQAETHARYGGIVPELASRQHMVTIVPAVRQALDEAGLELETLDAIAVTHGPGLAGSLLIGVGAAKGLALAADLPLLGVNHLEGHVYAAWLEDGDPEREIGFPLLCLITSGGHTGPGRHGGPRALRAARAHQGRRRRGGVRQGGPRPRAGIPGWPCHPGRRRRRRRHSRAVPTAPTSSARSTSPSAASRPP